MSAAARVAVFLGAYFAAIAVNGFLPLFLADKGLNADAIGTILGAATLMRVLSGPGWGQVADRIGRRRPVLLTAAVAAASFAAAYTQVSDYAALLVIAAGQGIAASAINPLTDSLLLALAAEGRLQYGPVRAVGSAAFMLATAGAGWLLGKAGSWLVPWCLTALYSVTFVATGWLPEAQAPPAAPPSAMPQALAGRSLLRNPAFRLAVGSTALIQGAHATYYGFAALFWRSQGFSDTVIGLLIAEGIVAEILLFARGRRLIEHLGPPGLTACAAVASILRWTVIAAAPGLPVLIAVQPLHAATFAMQHLSSMLLLSRFVPPGRAATAQALHTALGYGAPTGLMLLVVGWIYARSPGVAFLATAVLGGSALLLVRPIRAVVVIRPAER